VNRALRTSIGHPARVSGEAWEQVQV